MTSSGGDRERCLQARPTAGMTGSLPSSTVTPDRVTDHLTDAHDPTYPGPVQSSPRGSCLGWSVRTISRDESSSRRAGGCGSVGADDDSAECARGEGVQGGLRLVEREDLLDGQSRIAAGQTVADASSTSRVGLA